LHMVLVRASMLSISDNAPPGEYRQDPQGYRQSGCELELWLNPKIVFPKE